MCSTRKNILKKVEKELKENGYNYLDRAALENLFQDSTINKYLNDIVTVEVVKNNSRLSNVFIESKWIGDFFNTTMFRSNMLGARITPEFPSIAYEFQNKTVEVITGTSTPGNIKYDLEHRQTEKINPVINPRELLIFVLIEEGCNSFDPYRYCTKTIYIYIPERTV